MTTQANATIPDALSFADSALAVARMLKGLGNKIVSIRLNAPEWFASSPCSVELNESDFRRQFAGREVEETTGSCASLRTECQGVRVWCSIPSPPVARSAPRKVVI